MPLTLTPRTIEIVRNILARNRPRLHTLSEFEMQAVMAAAEIGISKQKSYVISMAVCDRGMPLGAIVSALRGQMKQALIEHMENIQWGVVFSPEQDTVTFTAEVQAP